MGTVKPSMDAAASLVVLLYPPGVKMVYTHTRNYENLNKVIFEGAGAFNMPRILPVSELAEDINWIGFNFAKTCEEPELHGVHFFVDDYQFQRVWAQPDA